MGFLIGAIGGYLIWWVMNNTFTAIAIIINNRRLKEAENKARITEGNKSYGGKSRGQWLYEHKITPEFLDKDQKECIRVYEEQKLIEDSEAEVEELFKRIM
jgi:hypothetical protein